MSDRLGYDDTPFLSPSGFRVHDSDRPLPRVVSPGGSDSQGEPAAAPSDAVMLFSGRDLSRWISCHGGPARWTVENGCIQVAPGTGDIQTTEEFGDCQLHLEWAAPLEVRGASQGRGNSGVFLMGRFEIQVLDCYNNPTYADGVTAAIYGQYPPLVNACRPPGEWQTYDILWRAPRFEGDQLSEPACVTVLHNGVAVHHTVHPMGPTQHRALASYEPMPPVGPLKLQDHGDLVRYRNIWYRPLLSYDQP
ncbi:MAG TPA: DUF1080 domain-containing protein [Chthonomonadales bacterium]|nr:DUF1080 domain-containing protein [Chthonomonadales bacterium]